MKLGTVDRLVKPAPKELTFDEIRKVEGVYKPSLPSSGNSTTRLLVLCREASVQEVMYCTCETLEIAAEYWQRQKFVKMDEEVYITIR